MRVFLRQCFTQLEVVGWLTYGMPFPFRKLSSTATCIAVVLRDLDQKKASLVTHSVQTLKKNRTLKNTAQKPVGQRPTENHQAQ